MRHIRNDVDVVARSSNKIRFQKNSIKLLFKNLALRQRYMLVLCKLLAFFLLSRNELEISKRLNYRRKCKMLCAFRVGACFSLKSPWHIANINWRERERQSEMVKMYYEIYICLFNYGTQIRIPGNIFDMTVVIALNKSNMQRDGPRHIVN